MPRRIDNEVCVGCGTCQRVCIVGCIKVDDKGKRIISENACVDCGACQYACPLNCISH